MCCCCRIAVRIVAVALVLSFAVGGARGSGAVAVQVLHDSGERIVLDFRFGEPASRTVSIGGESYLELAFPGEPVTMEKGAPALPHVNRSVVVPDDARLTVRVIGSEYRESFARIAPSKGTLLRSVDPESVPWEFGPAYRTPAFHPAEIARLGEPYILRDRRGVSVRVHPFQFQPVTGILRAYSRVTVEIAVAGPGGANVLERAGRPARESRAFGELYAAHFLNEPAPLYAPIDEEGTMLIICHDAWIPDMAPFVAHKAEMGIAATVVGVSSIGNNATAIKSYIASAYAQGNLAFVLLVGDIAQVASLMVLGGASDPAYSKLAGSDSYPEILVGRFSAATAAEVNTQVQRTIHHESLPANEEPWFWQATGIASAEGAGIGDEGQSDKQHMSQIRDWLLGAGYTEVDPIYDPGATAGMVTTAVNAGRGLINYTGHGWAQGWGTTGFDNGDVDTLANGGMLPFVFSVACNNGEFESYAACFAEAWLRATDGGEPAGAVAMYASSISQYWAEPMEAQDEFNLLLTDPGEPYHGFGALCFAASSSMMDDYGASGVDMFDTWILFGDPSLRVRGSAGPHGLLVEPAAALSIDGPAGGPFAPASFAYTLSNPDDEPLDYAVTATAPWLAVGNAQGTIAGGGAATVTVAIAPAAFNRDNGTYTAALEFVNLTDHDGDAVRPAKLTVGIPQIQERFTLDEAPFWWGGRLWEYGRPLGQGGDHMGNPDPTCGATGDNVFGVNLAGDYPAGIAEPSYLATSPIDMQGTYGAQLRYARWLNMEGPPMASATVEVKSGDSDWARVWSNDEAIGDSAWSVQAHDLAAVTDGEASVSVRWGWAVLDAEALPCAGWNIDDIEIWAMPEGTARIDLTVDRTTLEWTPAQAALAYDVVEGDLAALLAGHGDFSVAALGCVATGVPGPTLPFAGEPGPGQARWILVRGRSADGPLTYQALHDSQVGLRDGEIAASGADCP